jgi:RNA polymerase sigma-70 factor (ECF subfamily)
MSGDSRAEEELVERYSRGVSVIISRSGGAAALEDLCQDTFRIAIEKIRRGDVRQPERLSGFIAGLAKNLVIEHFRRAARQESLDSLDTARPLADPAPGPADHVLQKEKAAIARKVLSEMSSDRDRQILFRYYVAEEDKETICADLGLTSLHFNRVLYRARDRYRELYKRVAHDT